jgi:hypothetical protein
MFELLDTVLMPLTREYAQEFAALPSFDGDRQRDSVQGRARIRWLAGLVATDQFHSPKWAVAWLNNTMYRVNGSHSSFMLANITSKFPEGLKVVVDHFRCQSQEDLAYLFDQFDNRHSLRSVTDKVQAHKACETALASISTTMTKMALSGICWYNVHYLEGPQPDEDERVSLVHSFPEFIHWVRPFLAQRWLRRAGVIAAMFGTMGRDRRAATEFWTHVAEENHPENTHPTRELASFLRDATHDRKLSGAPKWDSRAFFVKSIHAWTAWRQGRLTKLKYHPRAGLPKIA